jgi:hypothetical protein
MKHNELVNCDLCGRDTRNKSRVCRHCTGGKTAHQETAEDRERQEVCDLIHHGEEAEDDVARAVWDAMNEELN